MIGSVFGVGILGTIQVLITFDGTLSSWWTRIVIGALLCVFCVLQRVIERHATRRRTGGTGLGARPADAAPAARPAGTGEDAALVSATMRRV